MSNLKLKICGMRDPANIADVAKLKPDFMGFIFYDRSPRYVGEDFRIPEMPPEIKKVGVFVNAPVDEILSLAEKNQFSIVQLHGDESVEVCREVRGHGLQIIKAFRVNDELKHPQLDGYARVVDWFLFDTAGAYYGGNARTFDWSKLNGYNLSVPFFLSGGLNPENIGAAGRMEMPRPGALDVNSGVESAPGLKDIAKIRTIQEELKKRTV